MSVTDELRKRIEDGSSPEPMTGCWLWTGFADRSGYGRMSIKNRPTLVHRASYEAYRGAIPPGICVCHRCDTPACVNPDHLFLGTVEDNNADMRVKGRAVMRPAQVNISKTHCPSGHPYNEENTRQIRTGGRACRACARERWRKQNWGACA